MMAGPGRYQTELADVVRLRITCDDCGRERRWPPYKVREAERAGVRTIPELGSRVICPHCRDRGASGRNVSVVPTLRRGP
jgi:RNase P subunit RPR2